MCAKAIDIGTSFIVGAEVKDGREVFRIERDAFFSMPREDFAEEMLSDAGAFYVVKGDRLFVVGEDALKFSMLTGKEENYRRPMARGVLNPGEEEAVSMLELLIEGIVGKPAYPGEVVAATVPAPPVDADFDLAFHRIVIERCLQRLGYEPKLLVEGLSIVFAENPQATSDGQEVPFTGIGISFGAGMTNLALSWRAKSLIEISVARGGDWIDEKVAGVRGVLRSKVTNHKEKRFDLTRVERQDALGMALEIYHEELIRYSLDLFRQRFKESNIGVDVPIEIVIAGGTAMVPGFLERFQRILAGFELPFPVKGVRLAHDPLKAVAAGALVAAISAEKRKGKGPAAAAAEPPKTPAAAAPVAPPAGAGRGTPEAVRRPGPPPALDEGGTAAAAALLLKTTPAARSGDGAKK